MKDMLANCTKYFVMNHWKKDIEAILIVFLYIFSFYIIGPITSSMLIGTLIIPYFLPYKRSKWLMHIAASNYVVTIWKILILLMCLSLFFSIVHGTYDLSYIKILFGQLIHFLFGIIVLSYLRLRYQVGFSKCIMLIAFAYLLQSIIELIASSVPSMAEMVLYFSRAEDLQEGYGGVRGLALSSAAGWSLALSYGIVFILYVHRYLLKDTYLVSVIGYLLLFVGCFFAGRTGLIGAVAGILYYVIKKHLLQSSILIVKIIIVICFVLSLIPIVSSEYMDFMTEKVFPFAFEPIYNFVEGKGLSSGSTDVLSTMWDRPVDEITFFIGSGHFTNSDGSYYLGTDVGVLRNIFYWGIIGYLILIAYQWIIIRPILRLQGCKMLIFVIITYLCACEYKAVTIGLNKMVFSILFMIGFFISMDLNKPSTYASLNNHPLLQ